MGQVYVYLFMVGLIATVYFYFKTKSSILKKILKMPLSLMYDHLANII